MHKLLLLGAVTALIMSTLGCDASRKSKTTPEVEVEEHQTQNGSVQITFKDELLCDHAAVVLSDGADPDCAFLIKMPNGIIYQPIGTPDPDFTFSSGDQVRITYKVKENYELGCPRASAVIEMTCLVQDVQFDSSQSQECINTIDAFSVDWMHKVIRELDPTKITKFDYNNEYAYGFENKSREVIFDCRGKEVCRKDKSIDSCQPIRNFFSNQQVILVVNN